MAKVSISEAARLAGISRSYLYRKYITPGKISVEKDNTNSPVVDTSEIMRVFGSLHGDSEQHVNNTQVDTPEKDSQSSALQLEVQLLREQLATVLDDKKWLQGKVDQLTSQLEDTTRLLEHKATKEPQLSTEKKPLQPKSLGFFARFFGGRS